MARYGGAQVEGRSLGTSTHSNEQNTKLKYNRVHYNKPIEVRIVTDAACVCLFRRPTVSKRGAFWTDEPTLNPDLHVATTTAGVHFEWEFGRRSGEYVGSTRG